MSAEQGRERVPHVVEDPGLVGGELVGGQHGAQAMGTKSPQRHRQQSGEGAAQG